MLHEDFDVTVLRNGAQVLDDVPVLEVLVEGDLLVQRLRVPEKKKEKSSRSEPLSTEADSILLSCFQSVSDPPAVSLGDFFDGDPDLVAEVSPSVHHAVGAPAQHHPVARLVGVVLILTHKQKTDSKRRNEEIGGVG